ncbi:LPP20 family lipoprotein [Halanaerobaculum tunisiense]
MFKRLGIYSVTFLLILSLVLGVGAEVSQADDLFSNENKKAEVNWEKSVVKAQGYGVAPDYINNDAQAKLMAREAAITLAQRRLLETINGVQIDSSQTIKNAQIESNVVNKKLSGVIKDASIIKEENPKQEVYKVVMEVKFYGPNGVLKAIFPELEGANNQSKQQQVNNSTGNLAQDYTGIIINTLNLDVEAALAPKVYSGNGNLVYGMDVINSEGVITDGIVGYSRSLASAKANSRIGNNPLVVNAQRMKGDYKTDIVLAADQARQVRQVGQTNNIFTACKVIIFLN